MDCKQSFGTLRRLGAVVIGIAVVFGVMVGPAFAEYPEKDIHMVIPFGAGGGSDTLARTIAGVIKDKNLIPVNILPENRSGGSGAKGYTFMAQQAGNPYYIATVSVSFFTTPLLGGSQVSYRDFTPVAAISQSPYVLVVPSSSGIASIDDLKKAGRQTTGTVGIVSDAALLAKMMAKELNIKIDAVPFDGEGEVMAALLGNHVSIGFLNPSEALSQIAAGSLTPIAISSNKRSSAFPDVPTFKELGYEIVHSQLRGLVMPGNVPPEAVAYWEGILKKVAESGEWKTKYIDRYNDIPSFSGAEDYAKEIVTINNRYETLMKELGIIK